MKSTVISVRVSSDDYTRLQERAQGEGRPVSWVIRELIRAGLGSGESVAKPKGKAGRRAKHVADLEGPVVTLGDDAPVGESALQEAQEANVSATVDLMARLEESLKIEGSGPDAVGEPTQTCWACSTPIPHGGWPVEDGNLICTDCYEFNRGPVGQQSAGVNRAAFGA